MAITFRRAEKADISIIRTLADRIWRHHYADIISSAQINYMLGLMYSEKSLNDQLEIRPFTLIMKEGVVIGYFSVSEMSDCEYFLHKFYVDTTLQRSGAGSAAMVYLLGQLSKGSCIRLQVNRRNVSAINFYFKHGFKIDYAKDFAIGDGYTMDDFVMERKII